MRRSITRTTSVAASLALVLSACGGDDTGSPPPPTPAPSPGVTPAPTSTSTPSPSPYYPLPGVFGALGQTAPQAFAVVGYRSLGRYAGWDFERDFKTLQLGSPVGLRLDAAGQLLLSIADAQEGPLAFNGGQGLAKDGRIVEQHYNVLGGTAWLFSSGATANAGLGDYFGSGGWTSAEKAGETYPLDSAQFHYGIATPAAGVPIAGSASYQTNVTYAPALLVNFATGSVSGTVTIPSAGRTYVLDNIVLQADRSTFRGNLVDAASGATGKIEGRLVGPKAEEFIAALVIDLATGPFAFLLSGRRG